MQDSSTAIDTSDERTALVAGLRALANDIESSTTPLPTHPPSAEWLIFGGGDADLAIQKSTAAQVVKDIGGHWEKQKTQGGDLFDFTKDYGGGVTASVVVDRPAVCERVVTGTETVTVPAKPAQPEQVVEREVVEWRCEPLLADEAVSA